MTNNPYGKSHENESNESVNESLVEKDRDLSFIKSNDPAGEIDQSTIIRVRNIVAATIASENVKQEQSYKRSPSWLTQLSPGLRNAGVFAMAAFVFAAGAIASPVLNSNTSPITGVEITSAQKNAQPASEEIVQSSALGSDAAKSAMWWGNDRTRLIDGLDEIVNPTSAKGFILASDERSNESLVKIVAKQFGVIGDVNLPQWGGAQIGNGTDETVYVNGGNGQIPSWGYNNPAVDPWAQCWGNVKVASEKRAITPSSAKVSEDNSPQEPTVISEPEQSCTPQAVKQLNDVDAKRKAKQLLQGLVFNEIDLEITREETSLMVTAYPVLEGKRSLASSWGVTFVGNDVWNAYGSFLKNDGQQIYSIISAKEAVIRANDIRFSSYPAFPEGYSYPNFEKAVPASQNNSNKDTKLIPWPVDNVTINSATLGSTFVSTDKGVLILPAWLLASKDGRVWSVIAVEESAFDFSAKKSYINGMQPMGAEVRKQ